MSIMKCSIFANEIMETEFEVNASITYLFFQE